MVWKGECGCLTKSVLRRLMRSILTLFCLIIRISCFKAGILPNEDIQERKDRIIEAYGLTDFSDLRKIYDTLLDELYAAMVRR